MRAALIEANGPPENIVIAEQPKPEPGPGQVLVKVTATSVNPIDLYIRAGTIGLPASFPYILGCDVAGVVERVGLGATRFKPGDRVWGSNQGLMGRAGATAEYVATDEEWLHPTPALLSDVEAAAWALTGITAYIGLFDRAQLRGGECVFITGGSGGVGTLAIQMARAAGARVACTAGSREKAAICQRLGADTVIDYRADDLAEQLKAFAPDGVDVWFETQREPNLDLIVSSLRKRGRIVLIAGRSARPVFPVGPFYTRDATIRGFAMFNFSAVEQAPAADAMNQWAAEGKLKPVIARSFPLEETAEAHRFLEASTLGGAGKVVGKVVITI